MKKTYLTRIYNIFHFLILLFLLIAIFSFLLKFLDLTWQKLDKNIPFFTQIVSGIDTSIKMLDLVDIIISTFPIFLILEKMVKRLIKDFLFSLGKYIVGTVQFERFLKEHQKVIKNDMDGGTQFESLTIARFNHKVINKYVLDLSYKELKLFFKVPNEEHSQTVLKEHEE